MEESLMNWKMCVWPLPLAVLLFAVVLAFSALSATALTSGQTGYNGYPGDDVVITFSITNGNGVDDSVTIEYDGSLDWTIDGPAYLAIDDGQTEEFDATVSIPSDSFAEDINRINVTATWDSDQSEEQESVNVDVDQIFDIEASVSPNKVTVSPARFFAVQPMVDNLGNGNDIIHITVYAPKGPGGPNLMEYFREEENITVTPDGTNGVIVSGKMSEQATPGTVFDLFMYANSTGGESIRKNITITVGEFDLWPDLLLAEGEANNDLISDDITATAVFKTSYVGLGTTELGKLWLTINGKDEFGGQVLASESRTVTKADFDSDTLRLYLNYSNIAEFGDYSVRAWVSYDGTIWDYERLNLTLIQPDYDFSLLIGDSEKTYNVDDAVYSFDIEIHNNGNVEDTYDLEITSSHAFNSPVSEISVGSSDVAYITLTYTPDDPKEGTFTALIKATSQSTGDDETATVTAVVEASEGEEPDYLPVVIFIIFVSAVIALTFGTEIGFVALLSLLVPLYYRVAGKKVLDNYIRGKIHGYIIANPGDHYNGIKHLLGVNNGTLSYHLKVLERERLIKSRMDGKYKRYYPFESNIPRKKLTPIQKLMVDKLAENPGISQRGLAREIGESVQVVNYHVKNLGDAGVIEVRKLGNRSQLFVAPDWR